MRRPPALGVDRRPSFGGVRRTTYEASIFGKSKAHRGSPAAGSVHLDICHAS